MYVFFLCVGGGLMNLVGFNYATFIGGALARTGFGVFTVGE